MGPGEAFDEHWAPDAAPGTVRCSEPFVSEQSASTIETALRKPAIELTVENHGNEPATGVELHPVDDGARPAGRRGVPGPPPCVVGSLAPGTSSTVTLTVGSAASGTITVNYGVTAEEPSPDPTLAEGVTPSTSSCGTARCSGRPARIGSSARQVRT